jgi:hypothetical protein
LTYKVKMKVDVNTLWKWQSPIWAASVG